jgi:uncharacterized protein (TIGR00251 family)
VPAVEPSADGTRLRVQVAPRASRSEIVGLHGQRLRIRVAAPPVDGAANQELGRFLASVLKVPRNAIGIVSGQEGRSKVVNITGLSPPEVALRLRIPMSSDL